ncbi:MAG: hypothetical protein M1838_000660 [Thelocarpon superellum]|nr:MAG: hypothetical protein M1838_000660 [Thelocarpon superellum]
MLARQSASCRAASKIAPTPSETIWITDALLEQTLSRFAVRSTIRSRRHESSVPGPLEAQKRLAKRRMMNLTHVGSGPFVDLDPSLRKGDAPKQGQWTWENPSHSRASNKAETRAVPALPLWLTDYIPMNERPTADNSTGVTAEAVKEVPHESAVRSADDFAAFQKRLHSATTADEIRQLVSRCRSTLATQPVSNASFAVFQRLHDIRASYRDVLDFFTDPILHQPDSGVLGRLLAYEKHRKDASEETYRALQYMLRELLRLGLASDAEIRAMLAQVPHITAHVYPSREERGEAVKSFLHLIYDSINSCAVLKIASLQGSTLDALLTRVAQLPLPTEAHDLARSILASATTSQLEHMSDAASTFFSRSLLYTATVAGADRSPTRLIPVPTMAETLGRFPPPHALALISSVTGKLRARQRSNSKNPAAAAMTRAWVATVLEYGERSNVELVTRPEWHRTECLLPKPLRLEGVLPHLGRLPPQRVAKFVMDHSVRRELIRCSRLNAQQPHVYQSVLGRLKELSQEDESAEGDNACANIVLALRHAQQPYVKTLEYIYRTLRALSLFPEIVHTTKILTQQGIQIPSAVLQQEMHLLNDLSPPTALQLFIHRQRAYPSNTSLEACRSLISSWINDPRVHPQVPYQILLNSSNPHTSFESQPPNLRPAPRLDPSRLDLVERMAVAFAYATHLRPRVAYRYAHRCSRYVVAHRTRLTAPLTRALTHAGITRSLQQGDWVPTTRLQYILHQVRTIEGAPAAADLDELVLHWRDDVAAAAKMERLRPASMGIKKAASPALPAPIIKRVRGPMKSRYAPRRLG